MIRRLLVALCALLIASPAYASVSLTGAGKVTSGGGGGGYVGPGDIVSGAKAFWGARAYTAAFAAGGGAMFNIRRSGDGVTCDVLVASTGGPGLTASCSSGAADNGKTMTAFCTSACLYASFVDQTGNTNAAYQGTAATQPGTTISCVNSLPCWVFGGTQYLNTSPMTATAQGLTVSTVAMRTGSFTSQNDILSDANGVFFTSTASKVGGFFGSSLTATTASDSAWHAMQFTINGGSSAINVDGTDTTGLSSGANSLDAGALIGRQSSGSFLTGDIAEIGLWATPLNNTQRAALCHNQAAYYGITASC